MKSGGQVLNCGAQQKAATTSTIFKASLRADTLGGHEQAGDCETLYKCCEAVHSLAVQHHSLVYAGCGTSWV